MGFISKCGAKSRQRQSMRSSPHGAESLMSLDQLPAASSSLLESSPMYEGTRGLLYSLDRLVQTVHQAANSSVVTPYFDKTKMFQPRPNKAVRPPRVRLELGPLQLDALSACAAAGCCCATWLTPQLTVEAHPPGPSKDCGGLVGCVGRRVDQMGCIDRSHRL